jgi:multisubunit Na+/H+ antiporter MnhG subunit
MDVPLNTEISSPPPLSSGPKTTEFWLTLVGGVFTLLAAFGVLGPDWAKMHEQVVQAVAFLASSIYIGAYGLSRALAKRAHQQAVAQVLTGPAPLMVVSPTAVQPPSGDTPTL